MARLLSRWFVFALLLQFCLAQQLGGKKLDGLIHQDENRNLNFFRVRFYTLLENSFWPKFEAIGRFLRQTLELTHCCVQTLVSWLGLIFGSPVSTKPKEIPFSEKTEATVEEPPFDAGSQDLSTPCTALVLVTNSPEHELLWPSFAALKRIFSLMLEQIYTWVRKLIGSSPKDRQADRVLHERDYTMRIIIASAGALLIKITVFIAWRCVVNSAFKRVLSLIKDVEALHRKRSTALQERIEEHVQLLQKRVMEWEDRSTLLREARENVQAVEQKCQEIELVLNQTLAQFQEESIGCDQMKKEKHLTDLFTVATVQEEVSSQILEIRTLVANVKSILDETLRPRSPPQSPGP